MQTQVEVTISDDPESLGFTPHTDAESHMEMGLSALVGANVMAAVRPVDPHAGAGTRLLLWISPQSERVDLSGVPSEMVQSVFGKAVARQVGVTPAEVDVSVSTVGNPGA